MAKTHSVQPSPASMKMLIDRRLTGDLLRITFIKNMNSFLKSPKVVVVYSL